MQTAVKSFKTAEKREYGFLVPYWIHRIVILLAGMMVFFSPVNPGRILKQVNENASLFTTAFSYDNIATQLKSAISRNAITEGDIRSVMTGCLIILIGILLCAVGGCMSAGNNRMKKTGIYFPMGGSVVMLGGLFMIWRRYQAVYTFVTENNKVSRATPITADGSMPQSMTVFAVVAGLILVTSFLLFFLLTKKEKEEKMEMEERYKLFLMFLPVLLLTFVFAYLPIYGWRFAFFDYKIGDELSRANFVGFRWFQTLVSNEATRSDIVRVLRNTLAMYMTQTAINISSAIINQRLEELSLKPDCPYMAADVSDGSFLRGLVLLDPSARKAYLSSLPDSCLSNLKQDAGLPAGLHQRDQDRVLSFYGTDLFQCPSGSFTSDLLHLYHLFCRP